MDPRMMLELGGGEDPDLYPPLGPVITPAELLARHYTRVPGGILQALADAAEYDRNPEWAVPLDADQYLRPIRVKEAEAGMPGSYSHRDRLITILSGLADQRPVVEHEATHAALLGALPEDEVAMGQNLALPLVDMGLPQDEAEYVRYLLRPAEIDARAAEAKRMYARERGILVDDEAKAAEAMEFYRQNYDAVSPQNAPTMRDDFKIYDEVPGIMEEILKRMPGVVMASPGSALPVS